jgi:hypothetical protein
MNLSTHFTLAELTFSRTAAAKGIPNVPDDAQRDNLVALCTQLLEPLRDAAGGPLKITSGYRSPELNRALEGSASRSQHTEGKAADVQPSGISVLDLFQAAIRRGLPFDQIIYEDKSQTSKWVHVSHDPAGNRGQILHAHFPPPGMQGKVRYEPLTVDQALGLKPVVSRAVRRLDAWEYDEVGDEPPEPKPRFVTRRVTAKAAPAAPKAGAPAPVGKAAAARPAKTSRPATAKSGGVKQAAAKPPARAEPKKAVVKKVVVKKAAPKKTTPRKAASRKIAPRKTPAARRAGASR